MESDTLCRKYAVDIRIWPIFRFIEEKEIRNISIAFVFNDLPGNSALYVTKNDEVFGIGRSKYNVFGTNVQKPILNPIRIDELCGKKIKYFSCGFQHVMALTEKGKVYNWGINKHDALGTRDPDDLEGPSIVRCLLDKKVVQIACSTNYSLVLCDNYEVYEWGSRWYDTKKIKTGSVETLVQGELKNKQIISVACSKDASFALSRDGCVYSWGFNCYGILGRKVEDGEEKEQEPALVEGLRGIIIKKIATGWVHILALSDKGTLYSWGRNFHGQLGSGRVDENSFYSLPGEVKFPGAIAARNHGAKVFIVNPKKIIDIAASAYSDVSAAMDENCNIWMWGHCLDQDIGTPLLTNLESFHEVYVYYSIYKGTYRPITSTSLKKEPIRDCFKNAFNDEETSDLTISVEGKEIKVHKSVLRIRSNYFGKMFRNGWKENKEKILKMDDGTYEAYKAMLEFFYTDALNVPFSSVFELLALTQKYCEDEVQQVCEEAVKNNINIENVVSMYVTSKEMKIENLMNFCMEFMVHHFSSIVVSKKFTDLDASTMAEILKEASENYSVFKA